MDQQTDYKKLRSVPQGVKIRIEDKDIERATEFGLIITGVTANGILYLPLPLFADKYQVSYSTLCRNIEKLRFRRSAWKYFIKVGNKNYVSCGIVANRKKLTGLFNNTEYAQWLECYHWDMVGSVSYSASYSELAARKSMEKLFQRISRQYENKALVFFYVSEPNPAGDGWHNHFLFGYEGEIQYSEVKSLIENTLRAEKFGNRSITKLEQYDSNEYFIGYVVKKIHESNDGYDFLSNHLMN